MALMLSHFHWHVVFLACLCMDGVAIGDGISLSRATPGLAGQGHKERDESLSRSFGSVGVVVVMAADAAG